MDLASTIVDWEPTLTHRLLPGCPCGSPHPIALRSADSNTCPGCGAPAQIPGEAITERAVLTGLWSLRPRFFLWIGRFLAKLAKRI